MEKEMQKVNEKKPLNSCPFFKKQDLCLILILLAAAGAFFFGFRYRNRASGEMVVVYIGEEEYARLPLSEDASLFISGGDGKENLLVIQDGQADVTEASCPDQICVHQSPVSETGQTIVCMPNRVIVTVESAAQKQK